MLLNCYVDTQLCQYWNSQRFAMNENASNRRKQGQVVEDKYEQTEVPADIGQSQI